jgi:hypothetical protein
MRAHLLALVFLCACGNVPAAPDANSELCFDGQDNDGDTLADCADPDCNPTAVCVPSSATQPAGVVVDGSQPCPAGFTGTETVIHRGLQPSACTGCGCTVGTTTCEAHIWTYNVDTNECYNDLAQNGGTEVTFPITEVCDGQMTLGFPFIYGMRADIYVAAQSCTPNGNPIPASSGWTETVKFCQAAAAASGCASDQTCAPRAASADAQCALADGVATCDGFTTTDSDWYTDYDDRRTCGACFCNAVGGNCDNMVVQVGSDYSCINHAQVGDNEKNCFGQDYSPPASLVGTSTPPTGCTSDSPISGEITPTGAKTLCCAPS